MEDDPTHPLNIQNAELGKDPHFTTNGRTRLNRTKPNKTLRVNRFNEMGRPVRPSENENLDRIESYNNTVLVLPVAGKTKASSEREPEEEMPSAGRPSGAWLKCLLVVFAVASALCVSGPALYWRFKKGFAAARSRSSSSSSLPGCASCVCDCPPPVSLEAIAPGSLSFFSSSLGLSCSHPDLGLLNLSVTDCGKDDPELSKEMKKQFVDLLTEEVKLQEAVAEEHAHHMNATLLDANKSASQYQKEAEKCIAATEICEEARERAETSLRKEKKITILWERRARQLGWQDA
ncbi:hypothetical protein ZIOFF_056958 [Zingiber officinale]|uniref:Uncharacterized protein n=1 Tax=Zingiber officinale TaxID=94328 RepID=A0A8J5FH92_ZINOF|nr:hypothetical protein ZIOFF_056958 [Zingiber officinale]